MTARTARASDLTRLTLVEASNAVRNGEVTSVSLTQAALDAFTAADPTLNASIALDREEALEQADGLDRLRKAGRLLGSLHGVPLAHKDMYYRAGKPCTCGSKIRRAFRPTYTATAISRLEKAGSITIGSLNMAEFAQNPTGHNAHFGDCHNPWHVDYCTGGSSSGSGAAVAARLIYGALGLRHRRLHPPARNHVRHHRHQGHADARLPLRRHAALVLGRQRRPAGPHGARLRASPARDRGP